MFHRLAHLLASLFRRRQLEDDLDEELRSSFEMVVDRLVAQGLPPAEARRRARLEFGGFEQVKENVRDGLVGASLRTSLQDVRYAWRSLRRRPSRSSRSSHWRWESASTLPYSACSTRSCCTRCPTLTPNN